MKKLCFTVFCLAAICLFVLFSCAKTDSLYNVLVFATADDESLPAGKILTYGRFYETPISEDTLSEYLGLENYPQFKEKIEDLAFYSSLSGEYSEICALRLYSAKDIEDAKLLLERRITKAKRALNLLDKKGYAADAYIKTYGNTVIMYMTADNEKFETKIKKAM